MSKKREVFWIVLVVLFVLLQYRGYYIRNLKVDDKFLEVIVEKVAMLEEKRVTNKIHTQSDDFQVNKELNTGHMSQNSNFEINIAMCVQVLSISLSEYYEALFIPDTQKAEEALEKYYENLSELEMLLSDFKGKRPEVDILWEKGIFK